MHSNLFVSSNSTLKRTLNTTYDVYRLGGSNNVLNVLKVFKFLSF